MLNIPKSPTITKQVTSFLLGDDRASYLKGIAEDIKNETADNTLQNKIADFYDSCFKSGFDIGFIYCNKTGRCIGKREKSEIELLCRLYDTLENVPENPAKYIEFTNGCSPAWLNTDSNHLQALMKCDPCGYVMYILGYAARNAFKGLRQTGNKFHTPAAPDPEISRHVNSSLIIGFAELQRQPIARVVETAEMLQRFFTVYNPREIKWPMLMPHHYCTADGLDNLFNNMEEQISHVVLERNLFSRSITNIRIVEAVKKAGGTGGASNIIGQGKMRGNLAMDQIADLFISLRMSFDKINEGDITHNEEARKKLVVGMRKKERAKQAKKQAALNGNPIKTVKASSKFSFTAKVT